MCYALRFYRFFVYVPITQGLTVQYLDLGHLTDEHFVKFLKHCQASLSEGGIIVVKDNVALLDVKLDSVDSSVTRNLDDLLVIYNAAGLKVLKEEKQTHFPSGLYNVYMTALE